MTNGIAIVSDTPLVDSLIERYDVCRPHPFDHAVAEMCFPLLRRLGVPVEQMNEFFRDDHILPPFTARETKPSLTTRSIFTSVEKALSSMAAEDRLLVRSTFDFGQQRVFEVNPRELATYRLIGFASLTALIGSDSTTTVRLWTTDGLTRTIHVQSDSVVNKVCDLIDTFNVLKQR